MKEQDTVFAAITFHRTCNATHAVSVSKAELNCLVKKNLATWTLSRRAGFVATAPCFYSVSSFVLDRHPANVIAADGAVAPIAISRFHCTSMCVR